MLKHLAAFIFYLSCIHAGGQDTGKRLYKDPVFEDVSVMENVFYRDGKTAGIKKKYSLLDLYEAKGNNLSSRPLIIWMHGGGFKYGNKKSNGIPVWCKTFAQRGYLCAAINYRLSKKKPLRKFPDLVDGCTEAIKDAEDVISFFKTNHERYRIDTNLIILAGNSAGAMIALQAVYSSPYEMAKLINRKRYDTLPRSHNRFNIHAIVSFWGALYDSTWLNNAKVPVAVIYGSRDKIVPPENKGPLSGGKAIYRYASSIGIPVAVKVYEGTGHELQKNFNPFWAGRKTKKRWLDAGQFAAEFLYTHTLRSNQ
jgi:acetyl esterase/lipase